MTTSRREFFKTAAMGAVGAGAAFGTVAAEAKAAAPSKYDIIILGAWLWRPHLCRARG